MQAAAVRALADFIFAIRFHFISHNQLALPRNPALRLPACYVQKNMPHFGVINRIS